MTKETYQMAYKLRMKIYDLNCQLTDRIDWLDMHSEDYEEAMKHDSQNTLEIQDYLNNIKKDKEEIEILKRNIIRLEKEFENL